MTEWLPDADWRRRPGLDRLWQLLDADRDAVRYVGGAVRDPLLGLEVSDIDAATVLLPQEVSDRLTRAGIKVVPTGIAHGTVTAVVDHRPVEITTLRRDVSTDGRRATVAYTDDWREDAARRDFTINALSANPLTGAISDYFGGLEDLAARRVRFIGDPAQRIAEDHLRILRFYRFLARFGTLPPDPDSHAACIAHANSLMALSRERIADELTKLLALPDPAPVVALMIEGGVLVPVLPEIGSSGLGRLATLIAREKEAGIAPDPLRRLAALLPPDPATGEAVAARLRLSNRARKRIATILAPADGTPAALAYTLGVDEARDILLLDGSRPVGEITALDGWQRPHFALTGDDLMAMGIAAGPEIGRIINEVRARWIADGFPDADSTLAIARQMATELRLSRQ